MSIRTFFQIQAADIIRDLLINDQIKIKTTIFDCYTDKKIFLFQIFSNDATTEICMLQQIVFNNGNRDAYIFINAKPQDWPKEIIQSLLNIVFEKTKISAN